MAGVFVADIETFKFTGEPYLADQGDDQKHECNRAYNTEDPDIDFSIGHAKKCG